MSWTLIESQVLGASAASVTLGSGGTIPQTYKTLKLVLSVRTDAANDTTILMTLNGSSSTFTGRAVYGSGSAAASYTFTNGSTVVGEGTDKTANTFTNSEILFPNYAGSTNKPYAVDTVQENNATAARQDLMAGLWSTTSAITSMAFSSSSGNFVSGSTFTLYGLK